MHIMLVGFPPFNGASETEIFELHKNGANANLDIPEIRKRSISSIDMLKKLLRKD